MSNPVINERYDIRKSDDIVVSYVFTYLTHDNNRINSSGCLLDYSDLTLCKDRLSWILMDRFLDPFGLELYSVQFFYSDYTNRRHLYKGMYPSYSCQSDLIESVLDLFDLFYKDFRRYVLHGISG